MNKKITLISVDVEATGPTPGKYSMLSLGACVVGDTSRRFYRELKPISRGYVLEALKVGVIGLSSLPKVPACDPRTDHFDAEQVMQAMRMNGAYPRRVMEEFRRWIADVAGATSPIFASDTSVFDGMFTFWYLDNFTAKGNIFGHSGFSMNCFCKGAKGDLRANIKRMGIKAPTGVLHNALDDAVHHATVFEKIMARHRRT